MRKIAVVIGVGLLFLALTTANGTPVFGIHDFQEWDEALRTEQIRAVEGPIFQAMVEGDQRWPEPYRDPTTQFFTPQLRAIEDYEGEAGLLCHLQYGVVLNYLGEALTGVFHFEKLLQSFIYYGV